MYKIIPVPMILPINNKFPAVFPNSVYPRKTPIATTPIPKIVSIDVPGIRNISIKINTRPTRIIKMRRKRFIDKQRYLNTMDLYYGSIGIKVIEYFISMSG